jgi:hypothetical protein
MFGCFFFLIAFMLPSMVAAAYAFEAGRRLARNPLLRLPLTLVLCILFNCAAMGAVGTAMALWRTSATAPDKQPPPKVSLQQEFIESATRYGLATGIVGFIWGLKHCRPPKKEDSSPAGKPSEG